jgi:sulfite dehydrogenase
MHILRHASLVFALSPALSAVAVEISLPPETAAYKPSALPGYQLVLQNCLQCHSAHYPQMQPAGSPRAYWEATVKKMKKPFGAQFADEDIPAMVDYLTRTYGAEQPALAEKPPAPRK